MQIQKNIGGQFHDGSDRLDNSGTFDLAGSVKVPKMSHLDSFGHQEFQDRLGSAERQQREMRILEEMPISVDDSGRFNLIGGGSE